MPIDSDSAAAHIATQVAAVRAAIAAACHEAGRGVREVRLIAVTKKQFPDVIPGLIAAGIDAVGENRTDHAEIMRAGLTATLGKEPPSACALDFIGRVQGRQLPVVVRLADALHSLHERDHVERLGRAAATARTTPFPVFIQVNISGEASKAGINPDLLGDMLDHVRTCPALAVVGLMTMAPELSPTVSPQQVRDTFAKCRELAQHHGLARLSMGMSNDFPLAIAEGATDIRVGSRLFAAHEQSG